MQRLCYFAVAALLFSPLAGIASELKDIVAPDAGKAEEALKAVQAERAQVIRELRALLKESDSRNDVAATANCIRALGVLRAREAAREIANHITLTVHAETEEGVRKGGHFRSPKEAYPAVGALSSIGVDGAQAVLEVMVEPRRDPEEMLAPAALVMYHVFDDLAPEYVSRAAHRAENDLAKQRLTALAARLEQSVQ